MTSYRTSPYGRFDDEMLERFTTSVISYVPEFDPAQTPIGHALVGELFAPAGGAADDAPDTTTTDAGADATDAEAAAPVWTEPAPTGPQPVLTPWIEPSVVLELPRNPHVWFAATTEPDEDEIDGYPAQIRRPQPTAGRLAG